MRHEFWNLRWTVTTSLPSRFPPAHLLQVRTWTLAPPITTHLCHAGGFNPPTPSLILSEQIRVRHMDSQRILEGDTVGSLAGKRRIKSDPHMTKKPKELRRGCAACGQGPRRRACAESTPPAGGESQGWACAEDARPADRPGSRGWACAEGAPPAGGAPRRSMRKASSQVHQSEAAGGGRGPAARGRPRCTCVRLRRRALGSLLGAPVARPGRWLLARVTAAPFPFPPLRSCPSSPRSPAGPPGPTAAPRLGPLPRPPPLLTGATPVRSPPPEAACASLPLSRLCPSTAPAAGPPRTAHPSQCHLLPRASPGAPAPLLFAPPMPTGFEGLETSASSSVMSVRPRKAPLSPSFPAESPPPHRVPGT